MLKIHRGGAKASVEIFHAGQDARTVDYAKGPSALIRPDGVEVKEMDEEMMEETLRWYAETAASAKKIGFDSIFFILDMDGCRHSFFPHIIIIAQIFMGGVLKTEVVSHFGFWRQ